MNVLGVAQVLENLPKIDCRTSLTHLRCRPLCLGFALHISSASGCLCRVHCFSGTKSTNNEKEPATALLFCPPLIMLCASSMPPQMPLRESLTYGGCISFTACRGRLARNRAWKGYWPVKNYGCCPRWAASSWAMGIYRRWGLG